MIAVCNICNKKFKMNPGMLEVTFKCPNCGNIVHSRNPEYHASRSKTDPTKLIAVVSGIIILILAGIAAALFFDVFPISSKKSIKIGCPLARQYRYGWDAERGIKLAVEEINNQGGVRLNGSKIPFEVIVMDTKDLDPGVPVSTALNVVEELITEKKVDFILGGPVRSEAALAAMDLLSMHNKISITINLTLGIMSRVV